MDQPVETQMAKDAADVAVALATALDELIDRRGVAQVVEAMRYSLLSGGKRLRPVLTIWSAEACGGGRAAAMGPAVAIECVHAFSLIHDDLPALDNDDLRRGQPTSHVKFGEATAILAGDALLALAFEVLATKSDAANVAGLMVAELANATGAAGMIGGEWLDLDAEGKSPDGEEVERIHFGKTARLIQCACRLGGLSAGADRKQMAGLSGYGKALGLAFQIADDLLDVTGDPAAVGKRTGKDAAQGKPTYPAAVGVEPSRAKANALMDGAVEHLSAFGPEADRLRRLAKYVVERTH